jgi:hypothetical protein
MEVFATSGTYPGVTSFVLFPLFFGDKDNHTIFFICVESGWAGEICHHFESFTESIIYMHDEPTGVYPRSTVFIL